MELYAHCIALCKTLPKVQGMQGIVSCNLWLPVYLWEIAMHLDGTGGIGYRNYARHGTPFGCSSIEIVCRYIF